MSLNKLERAWNDPGVYPAYHRTAQERLKRDWPELYEGIISALQAPGRVSVSFYGGPSGSPGLH